MNETEDAKSLAEVRMYDHENRQLRLIALDHATHCSINDSNLDETMQRANRFLEFLKAKD